MALSFLGVGCLIGRETSDIATPNRRRRLPGSTQKSCLIGRETSDIATYVNQLYAALKKGGVLLAIETEKTDSMFSQILFEDVFGLREPPGLHPDELRTVLEKTGFTNPSVTSKMGLLYAVAQKS